MLKTGRVKFNLKIIARNLAILAFIAFMEYEWMQYLVALFGE